MTTFEESKVSPHSASVASDAVEQNMFIAENATADRDRATESSAENKMKKMKHGEERGKKEKPTPTLGNYFRVMRYGTKLDMFLMLACCLTSIGAGIAMPLMNVVLGNLVGNFTNYFTPNSTVTKQEFQKAVNQQALYIFYLFIGKFVLSYISMFSIRISGLRISAALRLAYLRATLAQPVSVIDTISPGKVSTRITTSSNTIQLAISQHFAMLFQSLAFTIGLYVVAFIKSWLLTLVASASLPFILITYGILVPPFIKIHKVTDSLHEEASALAFEMFSSIRIVVAFGAEKKLEKQHEALLDRAVKNEKKAAPIMALMMSPSMIAMYGTFGLTFWFGIRQYTRGDLNNISVIIVVLFSVMLAVMSIGRLASPIIAVAKAASAATELFITIDAEVPDTSGLKDPDVSADASIRFENVAFSYPSRPHVQILDGIDLDFEAGKVTAIVGPSGSGKSTVVALFQRWYDLLGTVANAVTADTTEDSTPVESVTDEKNTKKVKEDVKDDKVVKVIEPHTCTGAITIGGVDLRKIDLKWFRSQIGLVQQEPFLFNDTLFNNVAFGLCGTPLNDASKEEKMKMVEDACREAYAEEFISKLPLGYETLVGESGIKLSGGQRQRIAIARSIIKKPPILILDEATSAIDVRTERIVQQALDRVSRNRTTIVIAHRLSTIKRADKIIVLRKGKLVEQGSHEELLKNEDGVYYGLVNAQELTMEAEEEAEKDIVLSKTKTNGTEHSDVTHEHEDHVATEEAGYKQQGLLMSFGRLIVEQRSHWALYSIAILGILCAGAVYPIQAYIFANIIQVFTYTGARFVKEGNFWSGMFGIEAAAAITRFYRQEYLVSMVRKRIAFFDAEGHSAGSLTSKLSDDTTQLQQLMSTEMSMALIACVNLTGSVAIAFAYGWKLSLVGLFCALPPILAAGYLRFSLEMKFEKMNAAVFEDSSQFATEAVGAFRTVLSLTMEDLIGNRYQSLLSGHVKTALGSAKLGTVIFAASDSVELACMALSFWYGGTLLASREYNLVAFFIIYMAIVQGAVAAGTWFGFAPNMAQAAGAANRILSLRISKKAPPQTFTPVAPAQGGVGIEFCNVYFTYKSRSVPVLSNLNMSIQPGQFAALVGASGCGKSTTIALLERFYDATSGHVLYNDQDITGLDPNEYRKQVSLVSQEPTLYEGSIRDNVELSVDAATDADIERACTDAQIHDFIVSLPEGYATRLGPKGMSLSGGQKQRLSLARALLRKPRLLLLDEATSSLDSESEKLVQDAIERASDEGGRTVVAVAHRLATIQKADVIFVLGSGRVLERGDHQSLLRKKGVYYQMCQAQALDR
ncbi:P-loop containing nucleoside triphosphate hydrolase protein [Pleomassaria siparia CBS 279.74]|uniref:P-loop containing nucleoside triphosphate hydrolase protein n=1 Tax=Pleomassaria siparia CBS 279.74 TaxID=1314801 RepID=A0A6G1KKW7_9PLEO|nr:P-loop containing nucleoside triphosphate hydrolase protein [Pleomassaria siparia CBS 279.74]